VADTSKVRRRWQEQARVVSRGLDAAGTQPRWSVPEAILQDEHSQDFPGRQSEARMAGSLSGVPAAWGNFRDGSTPLGRATLLAARGLRKIYAVRTREERTILMDAARWKGLQECCLSDLGAGRGVSTRRAQSYQRSALQALQRLESLAPRRDAKGAAEIEITSGQDLIRLREAWRKEGRLKAAPRR
jgi:hypothetical protein